MFDSLPNEVLIYIASYLSDEDYVAFANTDSSLLSLLPCNKQKLKLASCYNLSIHTIQAFLVANSLRSEFLSVLDLSNCYWLNAESLFNVILGVSSFLKSLSVQGTKLSSYHIAEILKRGHALSELSLTLHSRDSSFWIEVLKEDEYFETEIDLNSCVFFELQEKLNKLSYVALHGDCLVMFTAFLCLCKNLQRLHLEINQNSKISLDKSLKVNQQLRKLRRLLPSCNTFHQLTCKVYNENETVDLLAPFINNILSRKPFQLEVLWVPNLSIGQYLSYLRPSVKALQTVAYVDSMSSYGQISCLRTHMQQFLRKFASDFPQLEMISFRYDPECFLEFCSLHRNIQILQLQNCFPHNRCEPTLELAQGLAYLTKLTKFSISSKFFTDNEDGGSPTPIKQLVNCVLLDEIEIGVSTSSPLDRDRVPTYTAKSSCLSFFSCFEKLTRLTLANLKVDALDFISAILTLCSKLKSLRLTKIISNCTLVADVMGQLKRGLPLANTLEDFRWELGYEETSMPKTLTREYPDCTMQIGPELLVVLQSCNSLRRFAIVTDQLIIVDLTNGRFNWKSLVFACIISPKINLNACEFHVTSSHPAFQYYLGTSMAEAWAQLPPLHFNEMVLFESQILKLPACKIDQ